MIDGPRVPPAAGGPAQSLVVFLHGYGADGNDLIGLGRELAGHLPHTAFVSPHAPEPCAAAPGGRQWFALSMRDPHEYRRGVAAARPVLDEFLDAEMRRHGVPPGSVALVAFSQGTMMGLHAGLLRADPFAGILGYSGLLADPAAIAAATGPKPPVLLIHGEADELIPVQALFAAVSGLNAAKVPVEWHVSPGLGHGIDADGLAIGAGFLARALSPRAGVTGEPRRPAGPAVPI